MEIAPNDAGDITIVNEVALEDNIEEPTAGWATHGFKAKKTVRKGNKKGQDIDFFHCKYCSDAYQGPSSTALLKHLRQKHPKKCPELLPGIQSTKPPRDFFNAQKMKGPFNDDIFMGKLIKWIVKTDQPFSIVDNDEFEDMMEYLKKDIGIKSRRTIMRRLEVIYKQKKEELKMELGSFKSKFSLTCDLWTSKNNLSFFGFTIHFIDNEWKMQQRLLAFKFFEEEHDGKSLSKEMIAVLLEFGIADRLLGVTLDNASNNTTMLLEVQQLSLIHI